MEARHAGIAAALGAGTRRVRRRLIVAALAAVGLTALLAPRALANFTPEAGGYIDHSTSNGHRLTFHYAAHTGTVHDFTLSSNTIFSSATVHHTTEGWRFTHYDSHHIVHGTWLNHYTVHGSICNLHIDPTGCRSTTSGKQFFEAVFPHGKPPEGPWTGTATNLVGATGTATFTIGPSNSGGDRIAVKDLLMPNQFFGAYGPLFKNEFTHVWEYFRYNTYEEVDLVWDDPTHMHGAACLVNSHGSCYDLDTNWAFTAHYIGNAK
jgi:hypothetical protein